MKISLEIETSAVGITAQNAGRITVDMDGIELSQLVDAVNAHGTLLRIAKQPGRIVVEDPSRPVFNLTESVAAQHTSPVKITVNLSS